MSPSKNTEEIDLTQFVEGTDGISVIRTREAMGGENFRGWNGIRYKACLLYTSDAADE